MADKKPKSVWNTITWLKSVSGTDIAKRLDDTERAYIEKINKTKKDRFTAIEKNRLLKNINNDNNRPATSSISPDEYIKTLFQDSVYTKLDNERISEIAPEIAQASAFMVSAIISPNDLRQGKISVACDETSLEPDQRRELETFIQEYIEERLALSIVLPKKLHKTLYVDGSSYTLVIPMSSLEKELMGGDGDSNISTESLQDLERKINNMDTLFGISNHADDKDINISPSVLSVAVESLTTSDNYNVVSTPNVEKVQRELKVFAKDATSNSILKVSDNFYRLRNGIIRNAAVNASMEDMLNTKSAYGPLKKKTKSAKSYADVAAKPFVQLTEPTGPLVGEPLVMEVPAEAAIPVFVPGNPSCPLGYFIVCDPENGSFATISTMNAAAQSPTATQRSNGYNFGQVYAAGGYGNGTSNKRSDDINSIQAVWHQAIVQDFLEAKIKKTGFSKFQLSSNPVVYKYLFNQYLCNRQTELLYVPASMMNCLAFKYGPDGRGISDLEGAKHILSLKTTLQECKVISALNGAIDRKKLTINSDEKSNQGYIFQQIEDIKRSCIEKQRWTPSIDPQQTANQLASKAFTVNVTGGKGLNYTIEDVPNQKESVSIEDSLAERLDKQLLMALLVPAAAMNALDSDEYSRSVVTANLFFSNLILVRQRSVIKAISDLIRTYANYSPAIRSGIVDIINSIDEDNGKDVSTNEGNLDLSKMTDKEHDRLNDIINSISIVLPPPNIAPNKAMYEVINDVVGGADNILNNLYPDELAGDNPATMAALRATKGLLKSNYITATLGDNGIASDKLSITSVDSKDVSDFMQILVNTSKAMIRQSKVLRTDKDAEESGGEGGMSAGGFGGGGFGGGGDMGGMGGDTGGMGF